MRMSRFRYIFEHWICAHEICVCFSKLYILYDLVIWLLVYRCFVFLAQRISQLPSFEINHLRQEEEADSFLRDCTLHLYRINVTCKRTITSRRNTTEMRTRYLICPKQSIGKQSVGSRM